MRFKGADGPFYCVEEVNVWRDKLKFAAPLFLNGKFVGFTGLIVQNLYVDCVAIPFDAVYYAVVCCQAVVVVSRLKQFNQDCVGVDVVGQHEVMISAT